MWSLKSSFTTIILSSATCLIAQNAVTPVQRSQPPVEGLPGAPFAAVQNPANTSARTPPRPTVPELPPTAPIVTLKGVCSEHPKSGHCESVITRDDLDRFILAYLNGTGSDVAETTRARLAVQYARTTVFSALAEKQGLEKNPALAKEIETQMKLVRMRILSAAFLQQVQTAPVSDSDIQNYYNDHRSQYEQVQVRRVAIPFAVPTESGRPLDPAAVKAEIEQIHARALAGEDLNQLQQDAFRDLHIQALPAPVTVTTLRRSGTQGDEAKALDLKPGEISGILDLPASLAFVKIEAKQNTPLESARQEIETALRAERTQQETKRLAGDISSQFNLQYLGLTSQPDIFGPMPARTPVLNRAAGRRTARLRPR